MKFSHGCIVSLLIALGIHVVMTWPLVRFVDEGIPASAHNIEKGNVRAMLQGDHLQLMYFFWLGGDMVRGKTPAFQDVYQFNTGSDADREQVRTYFAPFSFFYLAGQLIGGRALGINLAGFMCTWLLMFFTWGLCRRFTTIPLVAIAAALVGATTSYRWATLMNGSPTGYALTWIPALWWSLDVAIRDKGWHGSILAALSFLCLASGDIQAFFFGALATPAFCLFSLCAANDKLRFSPKELARTATRLIPAILGAVGGFMYIQSLTAPIQSSTLQHGRDLPEIALYSPMMSGLWSHARLGISNDIYIGFAVPIILILGWFAIFNRFRRKEKTSWNEIILYTVMLGSTFVIVALALGTNGPGDAILLRGVRKLIPPYEMIRQPSKIYGLMPSILSLCSVYALTFILSHIHSDAGKRMVIALTCLLILADAKSQIHATVCLLDPQQGAYEAVATDAKASPHPAHAMVVPLWPGDSAWSSLYQHYASLYRIRMLNGYHPVIPQRYMEEIFASFSSANRGDLNDEQLDELQTRGIHYLVLHENAFPEKVSPFPSGHTLEAFLRHPRLNLLQQDGPVWSFRIESTPTELAVRNDVVMDGWYFPARRWEAEQAARKLGLAQRDTNSHHHGHAALTEANQSLSFRQTTLTPLENLQVLLRVRGTGTLRVSASQSGTDVATHDFEVLSNEWVWQASPLHLNQAGPTKISTTLLSGALDIDTLCITAGRGMLPNLEQELILPATAFFRAGYTQLEDQSVALRKAYEPDNALFYGPHLFLPPGRYQATLLFRTDTQEGTNLGLFSLQPTGQFRPIFVTAGRSATAVWTQTDNLPLRFEFQYSREADMVIEGISITRLD